MRTMNVRNFGDLNAGDTFLFWGCDENEDALIKAMKVQPPTMDAPYASNMVWLDTDRGLMDYASNNMVCYDAIDFYMFPFSELSRGDEFYYDIGGEIVAMMKCKVGYDIYAVCIDETFVHPNNKGGYKGVLRKIDNEALVMVEKKEGGEADA